MMATTAPRRAADRGVGYAGTRPPIWRLRHLLTRRTKLSPMIRREAVD